MKENKQLLIGAISDKLTHAEIMALEANYCEKIKLVKKSDMVEPLTAAITKANQMIMHTSKGNDISVMVDLLIQELKTSFTTYTVEEVCQAIHSGSKKELNEFVHISVTEILKWVQLWNDKVRKEAIHKQNKFLEEKQKEIDEQVRKEKIIKFKRSILEYYNHFFSSGEFLPLDGEDAAIFRYLQDQGIINMPNKQKNEIWAEAQKLASEKPELKDYSLKNKIQQQLYTAGVKEIAEGMALRIVFQEWKDFEFDLEGKLFETKPKDANGL